MISVDKAIQIVLDSIETLQPVTMPILGAQGRILAEDIISSENIPAFDFASISGYAIRAVDTAGASSRSPGQLQLDDDSTQAVPAEAALKPKHAVRVAAGAPMPQGADALLPDEHAVRESSTRVRIYKAVQAGENIRHKGEDISEGSLVLPKGKRLNAPDIGTLSAIGLSEVKCYRVPRVSFLTTGCGFSDIGCPREGVQIRPAVRYALYSQLSEYGAEPIDLGLVGFEKDAIQAKISQGLDYDMFINSVGTSYDDFGFIKKMLEQMGMDIKFWRVALKPAKPFIFGTICGIPIFGLSGHPFSFHIVLEEFVRPALMKMMGAKIVRRLEVSAVLMRDLRSDNGVTSFIRGTVRVNQAGFSVTPEIKGCNSIQVFSTANGLIVIPANAGYLKSGSRVVVQMLGEPYIEN